MEGNRRWNEIKDRNAASGKGAVFSRAKKDRVFACL